MIKKIDANKYGVVRYAISSIEDIADLPREVSVGSEAILVNEDGEKKFRLGSDGWVEVVEVKEYDEDKLRGILEDAKVGYGGIEYETLEERLEKDFDNVYSVLDNRAYVEYEGCRIMAEDSLNGLQKETVIKGRTLQNLCVDYANKEKNTFTLKDKITVLGSDVDYRSETFRIRTLKLAYDLKANTTYTFIVNIHSLETVNDTLSNYIIDGDGTTRYSFISLKGVGVHKEKFTTTGSGAKTIAIFINVEETSATFSCPIILEGDYTQTPLEELPFIEGIESVGDKSKNLFDGVLIEKTDSAEFEKIKTGFRFKRLNGTGVQACVGFRIPRGTFNISYNVKGGIKWGNLVVRIGNKAEAGFSNGGVINSQIGIGQERTFSANFTNTENDLIVFYTDQTDSTFEITNIQIEEGTQATPYEPYYDGYKISGKSCGVNLAKTLTEDNYEPKGAGKVIFENNKCITMDTTGWAGCFITGKDVIKVKSNTAYYTGLECEEGVGYLLQTNFIIKCFDINNNVITRDGAVSASNDLVNFYDSSYNNVYEGFLPLYSLFKFVKFSNEVHSVKLMFRPASSLGTITNTFKNIIFVETDKHPTYEPYKETTYTYILDEPLRSLPDGVCDEIDLEKGVVTRRVKEVVLNGTENWIIQSTNTNENRLVNFEFHLYELDDSFKRKERYNDTMCDRFPIGGLIADEKNETYLFGEQTLYIRKLISSNITTVSDFKQWLKDNPTTVYYELANPITEYLIKDDKFVTLPNGVKDEAGRIVTRNVGKVVLNGSEKWTRSNIKNENHIKYFTYIDDENGERLKVDDAPIISPTFPVIGCGQNSGDLDKYRQDIEGLYADTTISISVAKNRLETEDAEGLKKWLSQNPITVYYELINPYMECSYEKYPTLPNGVEDEISRNSVLRKVGKVVLDGSKVFETATGVEGIVRWGYYVPQAKMFGSCICSMFDYIAPVQTWQEPFKDGITINTENSYILIYMDKYKEKGQHVEEVRALLDGLEVYYELETPYTEPINLDEVILDTTRLKSYEPITHITSDNYLPPTIKTQAPSDFNAVVLGLKSNNEALTSQVMSLRQTNDELETTNREQDDVIDVTLLALDEVYGMIDEGEIETMSMGSPMVNVYVKMIKRGIKTLDEVPAKYRAEVEKLI